MLKQDKERLERFGARVRDFRQRRRLSQEKLALVCGINRAYMGGVERGERNVSLINIWKIADGLGVKPWDLF